MILTTVALCAVVTYHEGRSTSLSEQLNVASVIYNRAAGSDYKSVSRAIYTKGAFSSMATFKPQQKFKSYNDMFSYYRINDLKSYATAIEACNIAQDYRADYTHFTDKSIKPPKWTKSMCKTKTQNFNFYGTK